MTIGYRNQEILLINEDREFDLFQRHALCRFLKSKVIQFMMCRGTELKLSRFKICISN
jgi:hypothetical protein